MGQLAGGICPGGDYSWVIVRGIFVMGGISKGAMVQEVVVQRGEFKDNCPSGKSPGVNCPWR